MIRFSIRRALVLMMSVCLVSAIAANIALESEHTALVAALVALGHYVWLFPAQREWIRELYDQEI